MQVRLMVYCTTFVEKSPLGEVLLHSTSAKKSKIKSLEIFMAKNEIARKENGTPVYSEKDVAERTSQGRRVVVEHVEDWTNGVTVDRQVQEETVVVEKVIQKRK